MLRRFLGGILPVSMIVLTLATAIAALAPIDTDAYPSGYPDRRRATFCLRIFAHRLQLYFITTPFCPRTLPSNGFHHAGQDTNFNSIFSYAGLSVMHQDYVNNTTNLVEVRGHEITVPFWMPAVGCAGFSGALVWRRWREYRWRNEMRGFPVAVVTNK